ncbi:hypothetical protein GCM10009867_21420 [Pedococcus aerophilus]|uniref:DUF3072 domain-containing protein n=1 Tax=Pedococcus aerophilus TaxID=436356 RepID=A0ABN3UQV3_9MICO
MSDHDTQPTTDEPEMLGATEPVDDPALEKDPSDWVSGDDPITESQKSYLDTLARQAGEEIPASITKAEASEHIDRLRTNLDRKGGDGA